MDTLMVLGYILFGNAVVWSLFFWQRNRRMAITRQLVEATGKGWVIPPEKSYYQGFKGFFSVKTMGAIGLAEDRIIFIPPLGRNYEYPLKDIVSLDANQWFAGNYRNGKEFVIIKMANGTEAGFQVSNHQRWMEEIRSRMSSSLS